MKTGAKIAVLAAVAGLPGCATVIRGTSEKFAIQTEPPGASAVLSTGPTCTTPCTIKLKRKNAFNVTIDKAGYQTAHAEVNTVQRSGAAFGNIVAGGIIGAVVDSTNGSLLSHRPNPLIVTLIPATDAATVAPPVDANGMKSSDPASVPPGQATPPPVPDSTRSAPANPSGVPKR